MTRETVIAESFQGVAQVHVRAYGNTAKRRFVGNVSAFTLKQVLDVQKQRDYTRRGGGTAKRLAIIQSVEAAMTWLNFTPENVELALAGDSAAVVGDTVADEVVKGYKDSTVRLAHPPKVITTVTNSAGTTTYDAGTHYEMTPSGLYFPVGSTIADAADLKVTYDFDDYVNVEAGTRTDRELEVLVEGYNEGQSGAPFVCECWRMSVPAADELALIGDKLGELKFSAECLKDASKGVDESAFYRVRQVTPT